MTATWNELICNNLDGTAAPNPGPDAWGALETIKITNTATKRTSTHRIQGSSQLGHASSNVAEYLGFVDGLRAVLAFLRSKLAPMPTYPSLSEGTPSLSANAQKSPASHRCLRTNSILQMLSLSGSNLMLTMYA